MGVIARTTSMAYKGTMKTVREIGAELLVDYVLESSIRLENNRVRITSQLIRVTDQTHIWAETYDRELTGVLSIQSEIGTAIARHVQLQLAPGRLSALAHRQTSNIEAYDLYLRGRYFWNQLSPATTRRAMEFYRHATELDPNYALAWSGIADAYSSGPISGDTSPRAIWDQGHEAVAHAISSGADLPECQTSLGFLKFWLDWDWPAAEAAFRKSIELDPSYPLAHRLLGIVLAHMGNRPEEATAAIRRARELDPLNAATIALSSQVAFAARDYASAQKFAEQAIATDPEFWIGYMQLGQALEQTGEPERAIEALSSAGRLSGGNSKPLSLRGYVLSKLGKRKEASDVLEALQAVAREKFVPPYAMALIHAGLDQREAALEWLQKAFDAHDVHLLFPVFDPKWDGFRDDPVFKNLLDRCGFQRNAVSTHH
jgi:tetratricopeptide (TPR) repeat protein